MCEYICIEWHLILNIQKIWGKSSKCSLCDEKESVHNDGPRVVEGTKSFNLLVTSYLHTSSPELKNYLVQMFFFLGDCV